MRIARSVSDAERSTPARLRVPRVRAAGARDLLHGPGRCRRHAARITRGPRPMNQREEPERTIYRFTATPATRSAFKLRLGICGAGGSGKSYSALAIAGRISERLSAPLYAIDSENGSLLKY